MSDGNFVDKVVDNLAGPLSKSVGQSIADVWDGTLGIRASYFKKRQNLKQEKNFEKFKEEMLEEVSKIPAETQVEPNYQIASQALENAVYCLDSDELRTMFVKLLGKTCNRNDQSLLHPSYPDIIKQMSPLDARMLIMLKRERETTPLVYYIAKKENSSDFEVCQRNIILHDRINADDFHISMSISALQRWGIINVNMQNHFTDSSVYAPFLKTELYRSLEKEHAQYGQIIELQKGVCEVTSFGRAFMHCCVI